MSQMPYGCHNRAPFKQTLVVQDGYHDMRDGHGNPCRVPKYKDIAFRNSEECSYTSTDLGQADPRCVGCSWRVEKREVAAA